MCDKSKRSKTIGIIIRNHQYVDGQGYRVTTFGESNLRYYSYDSPMRQSNTIVYRSFSKTALQDCISLTDREALEYLYMSLREQEETNSAPEDILQETDAHVEVETFETDPESKPKSNKRKWLFGLGASTVLAGIITYVIKKN